MPDIISDISRIALRSTAIQTILARDLHLINKVSAIKAFIGSKTWIPDSTRHGFCP